MEEGYGIPVYGLYDMCNDINIVKIKKFIDIFLLKLN